MTWTSMRRISRTSSRSSRNKSTRKRRRQWLQTKTPNNSRILPTSPTWTFMTTTSMSTNFDFHPFICPFRFFLYKLILELISESLFSNCCISNYFKLTFVGGFKKFRPEFSEFQIWLKNHRFQVKKWKISGKRIKLIIWQHNQRMNIKSLKLFKSLLVYLRFLLELQIFLVHLQVREIDIHILTLRQSFYDHAFQN